MKLLPLVLLLTGCSVGQSQYDSRALTHTNMAFVGIPSMFGVGFTGSTTPVTKGLSLTNKHVAYPTLRRIVDIHPRCDLALIKQDNRGELIPRVSYAEKGQPITVYGYSGRSLMPVSGSGRVLGFRQYKGCTVGFTDAGSVQGMSGGAVMNDAGELVGITFGASITEGLTYFIPSQQFPRAWGVSP